jgi:hypothetical protein
MKHKLFRTCMLVGAQVCSRRVETTTDYPISAPSATPSFAETVAANGSAHACMADDGLTAPASSSAQISCPVAPPNLVVPRTTSISPARRLPSSPSRAQRTVHPLGVGCSHRVRSWTNGIRPHVRALENNAHVALRYRRLDRRPDQR